ncbi:hypothetical protein BS50DRAFT_512694 [Corynespora cassiicola Philippines]|uniref:Ilp is an apoptosis inhibitor n=1 Tax=Corynespora cassiicola Philippines TaxID=1448308 RepID=A0A2T2PBZ5_CORCC|nr:hypothetical protein BS50DRAFT_512694 [Corynespora cassiicola Philippines]
MSPLRFTENGTPQFVYGQREMSAGIGGYTPGNPNSNFKSMQEHQPTILEWYAEYQTCQRYFVDHAQHDHAVQAVAALINICLPFQWAAGPAMKSTGYFSQPVYTIPYSPQMVNYRFQEPPVWVSLVPYIRRLVVTGMDREEIMRSFFGNNWQKGVGFVHETERFNFMYTAKSVGWAEAKVQYDMSPHESVPFLSPLHDVGISEIESAERTWSRWLAMEDWMLGPRAPEWHEGVPGYSGTNGTNGRRP